VAAGPRLSGPAGVGVKPPPGGPNLAQMALRPSDFSPDAGIERQGYVKEEDCVFAYEREFALGGARIGRSRLLFALNGLCLARSVAAAATAFAAFEAAFSGKSGRELLESLIAALAGEEAGLEDVRVRRVRKLRLGDGSVEIAVGASAMGLRFDLSIVSLRVNRVLGTLLLLAVPSTRIAPGDVTRLARVLTERIASGFAPVNASPPSISGTPQEGKTLTAAPGAWRNTPTRYAYRWLRCDAAGGSCADIAGATGPTYTLTAADVGLTIGVAVTAANAGGSATAVSAPTPVVAPAGGAPANAVAPAILGTPQVGQILAATTGSWANAPTSFAYRWQRCDAVGESCADIAGATGPSYTLTAADAGATIRVAVTAANAVGSATAVSAPTAVVT